MTYGGQMRHVGTSKLICETNQWTRPCVMRLFTGRFFRTNYDTSFVWEWEIYYSLVF